MYGTRLPDKEWNGKETKLIIYNGAQKTLTLTNHVIPIQYKFVANEIMPYHKLQFNNSIGNALEKINKQKKKNGFWKNKRNKNNKMRDAHDDEAAKFQLFAQINYYRFNASFAFQFRSTLDHAMNSHSLIERKWDFMMFAFLCPAADKTNRVVDLVDIGARSGSELWQSWLKELVPEWKYIWRLYHHHICSIWTLDK